MAKTHGMSTTRLYYLWRSMKERCCLPSQDNYKRYGGRGIKVCDEWINNFEAFRDWAYRNGYNDSLSIDRIDNNGDYTPNNCRWVTLKEQARNTRGNHYVEFMGQRKTLVELSEEYNVNYDLLKTRINKLHWSIEKALFTPPEKHDLIIYNGISMPLKAWARKQNINPDTLRWRIIRCGWPVEKALTEPVRSNGY